MTTGTIVYSGGGLPAAAGTSGTLVQGSNYAPGTRFAVNATTTGNVTVTFSNGSSGVYPISVGLNVFPIAAKGYSALTASGTCEIWY